MLWERQTVNKTIHRGAPDRFDYPCNYGPLSSLHRAQHRGIIRTPNITSALADSTRHPSQFNNYHWEGGERKKITLKMKWISVATQETKYSESPYNKCSLYQHDPPCARECCACPLAFVKSLLKSPWRQPAGPPTSTVPVESILALHSCGNKPVYHQRVTHANERLFVFHCAHAGVREFI